LRVLLTHQEPNDDDEMPPVRTKHEPASPAVEPAYQQGARLPQRGFGKELASYLNKGPTQLHDASRAKPGRIGQSRKTAAKDGPS
jgi:hypothetical protein